MKKLLKTITIILLVVIVYFSSIKIFNSVFCKAYLDEDFTIKYEGNTYCLYSDLYNYIVIDGEPSNLTGILSDTLLDYIIFPREYVYYLNDSEDINTNFIVYESLTPLVFVKEDFTFPNLNDDSVEAVWFSWDTDLDIIRDENIVSELVMCAKNGKNKPLNEQLYELITEDCGDSCFFKFKGYPITVNFDVETAKDGTHYLNAQAEDEKYTVFLDQYFLNSRTEDGSASCSENA